MKLFHPLEQLPSLVVMNHSTPLHVIITPWFAVNIWTISVDSVRLINPPRAPRSQESHTHHHASTFHFLACCLATDTVMCFLSCNWNTTALYFLKQKSEKTDRRYFESRRGAGRRRGALDVSFVLFFGANNGAPRNARRNSYISFSSFASKSHVKCSYLTGPHTWGASNF